ncbi:MAG: AmmeMemoRadiSam system protein A [Chloroflexi bacterium]|nr:AmmeMemoRadiSam system protein A [Chloroflexota bacterium]
MSHPIVALAREAITSYVLHGSRIAPPEKPMQLPSSRAGAFVSLHLDDELRGCIGTIEPQRPTLAEEVIANAISAATQDPRFAPVRADELDRLDISVDVLEPAERIHGLTELDPMQYGVIVELGERRGLLLPDLEGVDTAEKQVGIALRKAWISPHEAYALYRFRVTRYR